MASAISTLPSFLIHFNILGTYFSVSNVLGPLSCDHRAPLCTDLGHNILDGVLSPF